MVLPLKFIKAFEHGIGGSARLELDLEIKRDSRTELLEPRCDGGHVRDLKDELRVDISSIPAHDPFKPKVKKKSKSPCP